MKILRSKDFTILNQRLRTYPVVAILGPRQCGKTTLAKQYIKTKTDQSILFLDCEDPRDLAKLENPMTTCYHILS